MQGDSGVVLGVQVGIGRNHVHSAGSRSPSASASTVLDLKETTITYKEPGSKWSCSYRCVKCQREDVLID